MAPGKPDEPAVPMSLIQFCGGTDEEARTREYSGELGQLENKEKKYYEVIHN